MQFLLSFNMKHNTSSQNPNYLSPLPSKPEIHCGVVHPLYITLGCFSGGCSGMT